jgi:hypothetical protein
VNASVTITSPSNGATVSSPVQLIASGSYAYAMYVYANNNLVFQNSGSSIDTTLALNAGSYALRVVSRRGRSNSSSTINITVSSTGGTPSSPVSSSSVADQIAADMQGTNEGFPHGVPLSYDWANGPVIQDGNNSNGGQAITAWGVVYVSANGNTATNTRVNIRNLQLYFLQKSTGKWLLLQNTNAPDGAAYPEDFQGNSIPGDSRVEPDGTISVTAGNGYNFHFYPSNRGSINPNDIGGVVALFEARLIVGNPSLADDRGSAQYLASGGADYYPSVSGPGIENNPSVGNGKMKFVKIDWRSFAMSTLSQSQLESNPPPVDLTNILP